MNKREKKKRLRNRYTKEAIQKIQDRLYRTRGFRDCLQGAIEYAAWKILADMERRVENDGISLNDVLYPAIEEITKSIIVQLKSNN